MFHCEFSSQRGPDFYRKLRGRDREVNGSVFPALHYPECYLLHLGYKKFYTNYPELCVGGYTEMVDQRHQDDLRKMRARSKSWAGGTMSRTSSYLSGGGKSESRDGHYCQLQQTVRQRF